MAGLSGLLSSLPRVFLLVIELRYEAIVSSGGASWALLVSEEVSPLHADIAMLCIQVLGVFFYICPSSTILPAGGSNCSLLTSMRVWWYFGLLKTVAALLRLLWMCYQDS